MSISSTGISARWDSMKAISAGLASGLMTMGWKLRQAAGVLQLVAQLFERQAHAVGDLRQEALHLLDVVAQQQHAEGGVVVDQHAAFAVEHGAAWRDHRDGAHAVLFGQLLVAIGLDDLQLPEAEQQQAHQDDNEVGGDGQSRLRQAAIVLKPRRHEGSKSRPARPASSAHRGRGLGNRAECHLQRFERRRSGVARDVQILAQGTTCGRGVQLFPRTVSRKQYPSPTDV